MNSSLVYSQLCISRNWLFGNFKIIFGYFSKWKPPHWVVAEVGNKHRTNRDSSNKVSKAWATLKCLRCFFYKCKESNLQTESEKSFFYVRLVGISCLQLLFLFIEKFHDDTILLIVNKFFGDQFSLELLWQA